LKVLTEKLLVPPKLDIKYAVLNILILLSDYILIDYYNPNTASKETLGWDRCEYSLNGLDTPCIHEDINETDTSYTQISSHDTPLYPAYTLDQSLNTLEQSLNTLDESPNTLTPKASCIKIEEFFVNTVNNKEFYEGINTLDVETATPTFADHKYTVESTEDTSKWYTETEILNNVFMILFGVNSDIFSHDFVMKNLKIKHLTSGSLLNLLKFFLGVSDELNILRDSIKHLKNSDDSAVLAFGCGIDTVYSGINEKILHNYNHFSNTCRIPNCLKKYPSLLSLYCDLYEVKQSISDINQIISDSVLNTTKKAYDISYLMSIIYFYTENYSLQHKYLLDSLFTPVFYCFVWDVCVWITLGTPSDHFMITKVFEDQEEWKKYSIKIEKINEKSIKCIPAFTKTFYKQILAVGNYFIILRKLQESKLNEKIFEISSKTLYDKITALYSDYLHSNSYLISIGSAIQESLGNTINEMFCSIGKILFNVFCDKFELLGYLKSLRSVYFLEDPGLLDVFHDIFINIQAKEKKLDFSDKINNYFKEKADYKHYQCADILNPTSLNQIKISNALPEAFKFLFEDSESKYSEIQNLVLNIKYTTTYIKTLKFNKASTLIRKEFIHFLDCLEYYTMETIINSRTYEFKNALKSIDNVYKFKKQHKVYLNKIHKRLFLVHKEFLLKVYSLLETINQFCEFYSLDRQDKSLKKLYRKFRNELEQVLNVLKTNCDYNKKTDCNYYIDQSALASFTYNSYYK
jgi:Gamma tubulin complex component C-terminal